MEKWRKKISLAVITAGLLALMPNAANAQTCDTYCDPCDWNPCDCWGIDVFADFIYWKPCIDDMDYAVQLTDLSETLPGESYDQEIKYKCLCTDWKPGFRAGIALNDVWCEWRLSGSYTYLDFCDSSKTHAEEGTVVVSPLQFGALLNPTGEDDSTEGGFHEVKGKIALKYQSWDVLLSRAVCSSECYTIAPFIGAEGLILNQNIKTNSTLDSEFTEEIEEEEEVLAPGLGFASTNWKSDFCAYGVKFGTDYVYQVGDCLKLFSTGSFTIAAGDNDGINSQKLTLNSDSEEEEQVVQSVTAKEDDCCQFINGYHIQLGLLYESDMCGCDFAFRLGYEFVKWHNVPKPRRFPAGSDTTEDAYLRGISTSPSKSTIGFHGLLAGFSLGF